jgi:cell division septation protein DedD
MARDWRKVAMAVLAASALASVYTLDSHAQATKQPRKAAKAAEQPPPAEQPSDENNQDPQANAPAKKKRQDPAEAQRAIEGANKLLQAGKAEQATQTLTATLSGGNLPPAIMAKALYLRGVAYRQQSKPAQAISDLTSALWLKGGLAETDRVDATKQRSAAYRDAGLTETGEPVAATPGGKDKQAQTKSWGFATAQEDTGAENQQGGNWFKDLFGSWQSKAADNPPPPSTGSIDKKQTPPAVVQAPPAVAQPPPAQPARVSTAWSSKTQVQPENVAAVQKGAIPAAGKAEGKFRVQLATVRTEQEARALALKAKRELAGALAAREPEIDQAVLGNMGAFYRVRVGPFATMQETQALCARLKGSGFDCMAVTQ